MSDRDYAACTESHSWHTIYLHASSNARHTYTQPRKGGVTPQGLSLCITPCSQACRAFACAGTRASADTLSKKNTKCKAPSTLAQKKYNPRDRAGTRWAMGDRRHAPDSETEGDTWTATRAIFVSGCDSRLKIHVSVRAKKSKGNKKKMSATRRAGR